MSFTLSTDMKCDLMADYLSAYGVEYLPTHYYEQLSHTKLVSPATDAEYEALHSLLQRGVRIDRQPILQSDYEEYFDFLLERRRKDILHLSAFGEESVRAQRAVATEILKFPRRSVLVLPTNTFSAGLQPIIERGYTLCQSGLTANEAFVELSEFCSKIRTLACVTDTEGLKSAGFAVAPSPGKILQTHSVFDFNGSFTPIFKSKSAATAADRIARLVTAETDGTVFVSSAADRVSEALADTLTVRGLKVISTRISSYTASLLGCAATVVAYERKA